MRPMMLTNNQRKMHGLPLKRKKTRRKENLQDARWRKQLKHFWNIAIKNRRKNGK